MNSIMLLEGKYFTNEVEWQDVQGIVRWGYGRQSKGKLIKIHFGENTPSDAIYKSWLRPYLDLVQASSANHPPVTPQSSGFFLNIAVSVSGLQKLGLPQSAIDTFPVEFTSGMNSDRASLALGDIDNSHVDNWDWGTTENTPDLIFLVYAEDSKITDRFAVDVAASLVGIGSSDCIDANLPKNGEELFGYRDGISNPIIRGARNLSEKNREPGGVVPPGEFLFGYADSRNLVAVSPTVRSSFDPNNKLQTLASSDMYASDYSYQSAKDFGRNGSMLVIRQLEQDVDAFQRYITTEAAAKYEGDIELLYAKLMGRWRDGTPITKSPVKTEASLRSDNTFGFSIRDAQGDSCPIGSHIRRSNPRDTLDDDAERSWHFANRHRILRRGRIYEQESKPKGLMFMCLNVSIARQFEHIQRNWIEKNDQFEPRGESDPIIGSRGHNGSIDRFTESTFCPKNTMNGLSNFVTLKGGGYFFLPSITALELLSQTVDADTNQTHNR